MYRLWENLKKLEEYRWVELSHGMHHESPDWPRIEGTTGLPVRVWTICPA